MKVKIRILWNGRNGNVKKMDEGDFLNQIIYIKYKEENMKKALLWIKNKKKIERTRMRKPHHWLEVWGNAYRDQKQSGKHAIVE